MWEPNSTPSEEQKVPLAAGPSLDHEVIFWKTLLSIFISLCVDMCLQRLEESERSSEAGVTGLFSPSVGAGAGNSTQVPLEDQEALSTTDLRIN